MKHTGIDIGNVARHQQPKTPTKVIVFLNKKTGKYNKQPLCGK